MTTNKSRNFCETATRGSDGGTSGPKWDAAEKNRADTIVTY